MVLLDIARTEEDFRQCAEVSKRFDPTSELPIFGAPNSTTYIVKDTELEPDKVRGMIHVEHALEVRGMAVDPDYKFQEASFTLLHAHMEGMLRGNGHAHYYYTAPESKEKVLKILKKNGAEVIDAETVRLRKRLHYANTTDG